MENKTKKLRVAAYVRVSTDEQVKEGYGLVYQEEKIKSFVVSQDYVLEEKNIYRDEGYSGSLPIESRTELKRLFESAEKKEFDVVLVYRLDRFFRKTRLLLDALDRLNNFGVGFRSTTESFDTTNITGRFLTTLLGAVAEMERDTIKERTTNGRVAAAKSGKYVAGIPPYGYRLNKKISMLEEEPLESKWLKEFYKWMVDEKLSLSAIQLRANELKIPTRANRTKKRTFNYWHKRTLGRILSNETYTGIAHFRKYKKSCRGLGDLIDPKMLRPQDEWVDIPVPPLISPETFNLAQGQLLRNREMAERNAGRDYMFGKLIYCGVCGFKMFGAFNPDWETRHYRGVFRRKDWIGGSKRCAGGCGIYAESRLDPIWNALKRVLQNPDNLYSELSEYDDRKIDKAVAKERLGQIEEQLSALQTKKKKLVDLYLEDGSMDHALYKNRFGEYEDEEKILKDESIHLNQLLISKSEKVERERALKKLAEKISKRVDKFTYEDKVMAMHFFVKKIVLFPKENFADVWFEFPKEEYVPEISPYLKGDFAFSGSVLRDECGRHGAEIHQPFLRPGI